MNNNKDLGICSKFCFLRQKPDRIKIYGDVRLFAYQNILEWFDTNEWNFVDNNKTKSKIKMPNKKTFREKTCSDTMKSGCHFIQITIFVRKIVHKYA